MPRKRPTPPTPADAFAQSRRTNFTRKNRTQRNHSEIADSAPAVPPADRLGLSEAAPPPPDPDDDRDLIDEDPPESKPDKNKAGRTKGTRAEVGGRKSRAEQRAEAQVIRITVGLVDFYAATQGRLPLSSVCAQQNLPNPAEDLGRAGADALDYFGILTIAGHPLARLGLSALMCAQAVAALPPAPSEQALLEAHMMAPGAPFVRLGLAYEAYKAKKAAAEKADAASQAA